MTSPIVTECSKAPEPVERDPFIDEPLRPATTVARPPQRPAHA
jgi:hypothetical protein